MKLTSIELHPDNSSDVAALSFRDPSRQGSYNVKAIVGLDADNIVSQFYGGSGSSAKYNLILLKRDVIFRIGLNPNFSQDETYSGLRDSLYKLIASSRTGKIEIQFKNGTTVVAVLSGFVTKLEAPQFEKQQEVQITVSCSDAMLRDPVVTSLDVSDLDPDETTILVPYSTAPHGFSFVMTAVNAFASLVIEDPNDSSWSFVITPNGGFLAGDVLHFSSETNNKELYIVRGATTIHLADKLSLGSIWPILFPGANVLSFTPNNGVEWTSIEYYSTYWGV